MILIPQFSSSTEQLLTLYKVISAVADNPIYLHKKALANPNDIKFHLERNINLIGYTVSEVQTLLKNY